eukprot:89034-Hanusia_phi.AAC.2
MAYRTPSNITEEPGRCIMAARPGHAATCGRQPVSGGGGADRRPGPCQTVALRADRLRSDSLAARRLKLLVGCPMMIIQPRKGNFKSRSTASLSRQQTLTPTLSLDYECQQANTLATRRDRTTAGPRLRVTVQYGTVASKGPAQQA